MNKKILLYFALMNIGLYAIPSTVALFAGQHTSYEGLGLSCDRCHSDVLSQVQAGASYEKHRAAAANTNYTTYLSLGGKAYNGTITAYNGNLWKWDSASGKWQNQSNPTDKRLVNLDRDGNGITGGEICMLCHNATLIGSTTHTGIIVRVCDDDRCHGNRNNYSNSPALFNKNTSNVTAAGYYLSRENVHKLLYLDAGNQSSRYAAGLTFGETPGNANGAFISRGHLACEGCHTGMIFYTTLVQAPMYNHSDPNAAKKRY